MWTIYTRQETKRNYPTFPRVFQEVEYTVSIGTILAFPAAVDNYDTTNSQQKSVWVPVVYSVIVYKTNKQMLFIWEEAVIEW